MVGTGRRGREKKEIAMDARGGSERRESLQESERESGMVGRGSCGPRLDQGSLGRTLPHRGGDTGPLPPPRLLIFSGLSRLAGRNAPAPQSGNLGGWGQTRGRGRACLPATHMAGRARARCVGRSRGEGAHAPCRRTAHVRTCALRQCVTCGTHCARTRGAEGNSVRACAPAYLSLGVRD